MSTDTKKRRRFIVGTFVASTDELNKTARKFIVNVRYYPEFPEYVRTSDYIVKGRRKYIRE
jgi:hypothetical protein